MHCSTLFGCTLIWRDTQAKEEEKDDTPRISLVSSKKKVIEVNSCHAALEISWHGLSAVEAVNLPHFMKCACG